jgi:hypothetical protein
VRKKNTNAGDICKKHKPELIKPKLLALRRCIPERKGAEEEGEEEEGNGREVLFWREEVAFVYAHPEEEGLVEAYVSMRQHTSAYVSIYAHPEEEGLVQAPAYVSMRQHTSAYVSMRQNTTAQVATWWKRSSRFDTLLTYAAYVSMRQHMSAYVNTRTWWKRSSRFDTLLTYASIRQHASACVSIRQHTYLVEALEQIRYTPDHLLYCFPILRHVLHRQPPPLLRISRVMLCAASVYVVTPPISLCRAEQALRRSHE